MKKLLTTLLVILTASIALHAEAGSLNFRSVKSEKEFSVDYLSIKGLKKTKAPASLSEVDITRAYKQKNEDMEMRYTLFLDTGTTTENFNRDVFIWTGMIICNILGVDNIEAVLSSLSIQNPDEVKAEFNADVGYNITIPATESDFCKGWRFITIESFGKQGQGIVMRCLLFNDLSYLGVNIENPEATTEEDMLSSPFFAVYHSFRFKDKK